MYIEDLVYINCNSTETTVLTSGVSFFEFVTAINNKPKNILILTEVACGMNFDQHTHCYYQLGEDVVKMAENESIVIDADFVWVDFDDYESLHTLTPQEMAELYYMRMQWKPLEEFYNEKINNNYVYLSHDDEHSCTVWYKNLDDFYTMIANAVSNKINHIYDLVLNPFDKDTAKKLCNLSKEGIYLNLDMLKVDDENNILIPIYCMEKFDYIDTMYDIVIKERIMPSYYMKYSNMWDIIKIDCD